MIPLYSMLSNIIVCTLPNKSHGTGMVTPPADLRTRPASCIFLVNPLFFVFPPPATPLLLSCLVTTDRTAQKLTASTSTDSHKAFRQALELKVCIVSGDLVM